MLLSRTNHPRPRSPSGFTLIEMLAAVVIMTLLVGMVYTALHQSQRGWKQVANRATATEEGRALLVAIGNDLALAIRAGTNCQFNGQSNKVYFVATQARSELTPTNDLNQCELLDLSWIGYEFISDTPGGLRRKLVRPTGANLTTNTWRNHAYGSATNGDSAAERILASNTVMSLSFRYDGWASWSSNGLPRTVRIVIETVDAETVRRYQANGDASLLTNHKRAFETQVYLANQP
jgi:prepilin-type N-terminal cleavage/methylation domain-containing protein